MHTQCGVFAHPWSHMIQKNMYSDKYHMSVYLIQWEEKKMLNFNPLLNSWNESKSMKANFIVTGKKN